MKYLKPIEGGWESYRDSVLPKDAGPVQVLECKRAFYSGAWSMFQINRMIGEPIVSEEKAMSILDAVECECRQFVKDQMNPFPERN